MTERIKPNDSFEVVALKEKPYTYLYSNDGMSHFVNTETLDELELESDKIEGSDKSFLLLEDNMKVTISFLETDKESRAISFRLPQMHPYEVLSITPMVGHSSKGPAQKIVKIKGGIQIQVPEFINLGNKIIITTNDLKYFKRA